MPSNVVILPAAKDPITKKRRQPNTQDPDGHVLIRALNGQLRTYKPTQKQLKAEYYRQQGLSKRAAMKKAGYSMKHTATKMFSPQLRAYMNVRMQEALVKKGVTPDTMADKMVEWLDAKKISVTKDGNEVVNEDTSNQIKAYEKIDAVMGFSREAKESMTGAKSKRKMTIEEWTFEEGEQEGDKA